MADLIALDPTLSGRENLRYELAQRKETGHDTTAVERALSRLPNDAPQEAFWELFDTLAESPRVPDWPYVEPSTYDEIVATLPVVDATPPRTWSRAELTDRVLGGWLGRIAGCNLGKPIEWGEHWTRAHIRSYLESVGAYPLLDYVPKADDVSERYRFLPNWTETTRGRVHGSARDDDLDYSIIGLHLLERWGRGYTSEDVAGEWLLLLPILQTGAERVNLRNLVAGLRPPLTASHHNPHREWVGALIRADVHGWTNPGNPRAAALQTIADAALTHTGNGIYGEMWAAALVSTAFTADSPEASIRASLEHVPPTSRLAEEISTVVADHEAGRGWEEAIDDLELRYPAMSGAHTINNGGALTAAILWGDGDFSATVGYAAQAGLDADSIGATAGSWAGAFLGEQAIPARWIEPLHGRTRSAIFGFSEVAFDEMAERTLDLVARFR